MDLQRERLQNVRRQGKRRGELSKPREVILIN